MISFMQIVDVVNMQIYANLIYANIVRKDAIMQSRGGKHTIRWNLAFLLDELYYNRIELHPKELLVNINKNDAAQ